MTTQNNEALFRTVYQAIQAFNEQLPADRALVPSPRCELVGSPNLDSADVVNLLVMIEQGIEQDFGLAVSLFDGQTVEQGIERFVTVQALVEFLAGKIDSENVQH